MRVTKREREEEEGGEHRCLPETATARLEHRQPGASVLCAVSGTRWGGEISGGPGGKQK